MNIDDETTVPHRPNALEPRVVALEVGLDRLTADVKDLATVVRIQGQTVEQEIQKLVVAVTQAQAPKKTDWGLFISGVGLLLALGAAVLIPINNAANDNKYRIEQYHQSMVEHMKLDNHPVGTALQLRLEEQLRTHVANNAKEFQQHIDLYEKEFSEMRAYYKEKMDCMEKFTDAKIALVEKEIIGIQGKNDLYIDKLFGRVIELEKERIKQADNEHQELMQWRQKAMGLSSPDAFVPLIPRATDSHTVPDKK
jgi:hypothetical protein